MYHHLEGVLALLAPSRAVVEASGIGFECRIPLSTFTCLKGKEGSRVRLLTHLQVLEDDLRLYGFATDQERDFFRLVISIAGVGPAIALAALASFDPSGFASAIESGDSRALRKIKGVGPKLSERMVLELKDREEALAALSRGAGQGVKASRHPALPEATISDAVRCLETLGYSLREARERVDAAISLLLERPATPPADASKEGPRAPLTVEAIIQAAMRSRNWSRGLFSDLRLAPGASIIPAADRLSTFGLRLALRRDDPRFFFLNPFPSVVLLRPFSLLRRP